MDKAKQTVFITGATGGMGSESLKQMLEDLDKQNIIILALDTEKDRKLLAEYTNIPEITIKWGNLIDYQDVYDCVKEADIVLHIAAFVSPAADYDPDNAMRINYGSTKNIVDAIKAQGREQEVRFVYIGTVAETGDRMPPVHWGRVGDPIKPSMFDYYAVSKIAAERYVIESGLKYWVSLRQTGIMGKAMASIVDAIMFHNCLDNVLEYVSDRDSGRLMKNLCLHTSTGELSENFWGHIYNIGGGESCRVSTYEMYQRLYGDIGFKNLDYVIEPKWYATKNFHGQYYSDSDKLEEYLHFRQDSIEYFYNAYKANLGTTAGISKTICKLPGGQKLMGIIMKKVFIKQALTDHGTVHFIRDHVDDHIDAYWGSKKAWEALPNKLSEMKHFKDWDHEIVLDHGYDESKSESELNLADMEGAAKFRGGECLAETMDTGDWISKLEFKCAFGHSFMASPRLVLEGGHWCPECERKSWNYGERAKRDPFFAQVWNPLHEEDENREYPKSVSDVN